MIALLLVVIMVFPMGVFAETTSSTESESGSESSTESSSDSSSGSESGGENNTPAPPAFEIYKVLPNGSEKVTGEIDLYTKSKTKASVTLRVTSDYPNEIRWTSSNPNAVTVGEKTGIVTAVATEIANDVEITAIDWKNPEIQYSCTVNAIPLACNDVKISGSYQKSYVSGQSFNPSGMVVKALYNDADGTTDVHYVTVDPSDYKIEPAGPLTAAHNNTKITVTVMLKSAETDTITVAERGVVSVSPKNRQQTIDENTVFNPGSVEVRHNDGTKITITEGYEIYIKKTSDANFVKYNDTKLEKGQYDFYVKYLGMGSEDGSLTVKAKVVTPTVDVFTAEIKSGTTPKKTTYNVGDKFDPTGLTVILYKNGEVIGQTQVTTTTNYINVLAPFADADVGTNVSREISFKYTYSGFSYKDVTFKITVPGLTIVAPSTKDTRVPRSIYSVVTLREKYSVGETIDAGDIDYIRVYFTDAPNTRETIYNSEFANFEASIDLEVLTVDGERKSSIGTRRHTIQATDVTEEGYVTLRCYFGEKTKDFAVLVGDPDVSLIYKEKLIKEYSKLQDALDSTIAQDEEVSTEIFNVEDLTVYDEINIKLGTDQAFNNYYDFIPQSTIIIDLNGHKFSFKTTQIEFNSSYVQFVITNTNATKDGEVVYLDKDGASIKLAKGETLVFKKNGDVPGFYAVTVGNTTNGKITADATILNKVIEAPHGSTVKFTITPDKGYEIESVKVDGKSVTSDTKNYTVNSNGVATYTMSGIAANKAIYVTFKKSNSIENWTNPFYDISPSAKYYSAIKFVYENNLFNGYNEHVNGVMRTLFKPNTTMTRAMFVTVLGRLAGVDGSKYKDKFSFIDIPTDGSASWYAPYVEWAVQYGITNGLGNGKFGPDVEITHQEMYVFMQRYALVIQHIPFDSTNVNITVSDKAEVADWATEAVKFATARDFLITTSTNRITPNGDALRSELAMLLEKFCINVLAWSEK